MCPRGKERTPEEGQWGELGESKPETMVTWQPGCSGSRGAATVGPKEWRAMACTLAL